LLGLDDTIRGHKIAMPVYLSSVGGLRAGHIEGELAATRGADRAGTIQWVSGVTSTPIEEIVAQATGPVFQQLYYFDDKSDMTASAIERCKTAGVAALVLLGDSPPFGGAEVPIGQRAFAPTPVSLHDGIRFFPQMLTKPTWTWDFLRDGMKEPRAAMARDSTGRTLAVNEATLAHFRAPTNWADLPWIRKHWAGPIVMKGIVSVESARRAVDEGIDAIVVSNHGGNALDGTVPTIEVLPPIVHAVGAEIEILVDGGVARGGDVVKALALGARAVGIGRGYVYRCSPQARKASTTCSGCFGSRLSRRSCGWASDPSTTSTRRSCACRASQLASGHSARNEVSPWEEYQSGNPS
jgi:isopentenyl diphosphate isomerase/L-lactate dehydrogenase-like FMN-dependent dehydrogenase